MNPIEKLLKKFDAAGIWEKEMIVKKKTRIKDAGETNTRLFYILEGSIHAFYYHQKEPLTIRFGYPGDIIAALDSYITEKPTDLVLETIKKTRMKVVKKEDYLKLIQSDPEVMDLWNQLLTQLVYDQMEREYDLLISSPLERYQRVLKRSPRLFQEIPHRLIASYLRMTPETLSRIKKY